MGKFPVLACGESATRTSRPARDRLKIQEVSFYGMMQEGIRFTHSRRATIGQKKAASGRLFRFVAE
jgi:hypothetical protein